MIFKMLFACLSFVVDLLVINYVHFRFFSVDVVFYSVLMDVALAMVIAGVESWFIIFRRNIPKFAFVQLLIIFGLGGYIFAITLPTVIDRSYSIYMLSKLEQHDGKLKKSAFDHAVIDEFMREHKLADARLTEQLKSGTIMMSGDCVQLTQRGEWVVSFARWYRQHMLPQHRLLGDQYTDALTDPFRQPSQMPADQLCR